MIISGTLYILLTLALLIMPFVFRLDRTGAFVVALAYTGILANLDNPERATFNSLFVICSIIPAIIFGLPAGITTTFPSAG